MLAGVPVDWRGIAAKQWEELTGLSFAAGGSDGTTGSGDGGSGASAGTGSENPDPGKTPEPSSTSESSKDDEYFFDENSKSNSKKLGQNLEKAGISKPDYPSAAHHIVAGYSPYAQDARIMLAMYEIDINDAANGVFLRTTNDITEGTYHPSMHTIEYYEAITDALADAKNRDDALSILSDIAELLLDGTFGK